MDFKYLKSGYQGKPDQMRELAEKLTDPRRGHEAEFTFSKSAADRERMRPYKTGGMVKKDDREEDLNKVKTEKALYGGKPLGSKLENETHSDLSKIKRERALMGGMAKEKHEEYRKGGHVKACEKKFAMGGIAKERLEEGYKKGGQIKDCDKKQKFAAGGGVIAMVRLGEATKDGNQILKKKKSYTNNF